jgi:glycosyltransferase involved in cell wall biosynthesis
VRSAEALAHGALQLLQNLPKREAVRAYAERFDWAATSAAQLKLFSRLAQP